MSKESRIKKLEERVEQLENQLSQNLVEREETDYQSYEDLISYYHYSGNWEVPTKKVHELTIEGKVNAILDHLMLDISVEQEQTTGPSVKVKKITKKGK